MSRPATARPQPPPLRAVDYARFDAFDEDEERIEAEALELEDDAVLHLHRQLDACRAYNRLLKDCERHVGDATLRTVARSGDDRAAVERVWHRYFDELNAADMDGKLIMKAK
jgi:hypothetical protein